MTSESGAPQGNPGDIVNWPMLKIAYRTDPDKIAALLPPGISPGANPNVNLTIYNFPVPDEPEYGIVTSVDAEFDGIAGEFTLGYGIDQESANPIKFDRGNDVLLRHSWTSGLQS